MPETNENPGVRLTDTTLAHLESLMAGAVQKGISDAMTEETAEKFWAAGLTVLQRQATQRAGRFVIGGLAGLLRKASLFVLLGGVVYAIGGWSALAGLFKALFQGSAT
jgi:hypothetical protein